MLPETLRLADLLSAQRVGELIAGRPHPLKGAKRLDTVGPTRKEFEYMVVWADRAWIQELTRC